MGRVEIVEAGLIWTAAAINIFPGDTPLFFLRKLGKGCSALLIGGQSHDLFGNILGESCDQDLITKVVINLIAVVHQLGSPGIPSGFDVVFNLLVIVAA